MTVRLYRPSNGTEGLGFEERFCDRCEKEAAYRADPDARGPDGGPICCEILTRVYLFMSDAPEYPSEWRYGEDGQPTCTAFEEELSDEARERRALIAAGQLDLFEKGEGG